MRLARPAPAAAAGPLPFSRRALCVAFVCALSIAVPSSQQDLAPSLEGSVIDIEGDHTSLLEELMIKLGWEERLGDVRLVDSSEGREMLAGIDDQTAEELVNLLREYVSTNREILHRMDHMEESVEGKGTEGDAAVDKSVLELLGEAVRNAFLERLATSTDPECDWNYAMFSCSPYCHCKLRPRLGDLSLGRACRLRREEELPKEVWNVSSSKDLAELPSCDPAGSPPVLGERVRIAVAKGFRLFRVVLRAGVRFVSRRLPRSDEGCAWNWDELRCEPAERCKLRPRLGDFTLRRMCRGPLPDPERAEGRSKGSKRRRGAKETAGKAGGREGERGGAVRGGPSSPEEGRPAEPPAEPAAGASGPAAAASSAPTGGDDAERDLRQTSASNGSGSPRAEDERPAEQAHRVGEDTVTV